MRVASRDCQARAMNICPFIFFSPAGQVPQQTGQGPGALWPIRPLRTIPKIITGLSRPGFPTIAAAEHLGAEARSKTTLRTQPSSKAPSPGQECLTTRK